MLLTSPLCSLLGGNCLLRCAQAKVGSLRCRAVARTVMSAALAKSDTFFIDEFAQKQFNDTKPEYSGTRIYFDSSEFVAKVQQHHDDGTALVEGYAPFCKHIFVPNFTGAKLGSLSITQQNRNLLQTGYSRRRPEELPVLSRWFQLQDVQPVPAAKYLDCILYSREQLVKEYQAMPGKGDSEDLPEAPWGIISVKAQDEDYETPMQPITIMRNSLGREEGGSGVALDKEVYEKSVAYWDSHAAILVGQKPSGE